MATTFFSGMKPKLALVLLGTLGLLHISLAIASPVANQQVDDDGVGENEGSRGKIVQDESDSEEIKVYSSRKNAHPERHGGNQGDQHQKNAEQDKKDQVKRLEKQKLLKWKELINLSNRIKILKNALKKKGDSRSKIGAGADEDKESSTLGQSQHSGMTKQLQGKGPKKGSSGTRSSSSYSPKPKPDETFVNKKEPKSSEKRPIPKKDKNIFNKTFTPRKVTTTSTSTQTTQAPADTTIATTETPEPELPTLTPEQISHKYEQHKENLRKRLEKLGEHCPDLDILDFFKNWKHMFKEAWPSFGTILKKSWESAQQLRKEISGCWKNVLDDVHPTTKKSGDNSSNESGDGGDKNPEVSSGESDASTKAKRDAGFAAKFEQEVVNPVVAYFENLPDLVKKINSGSDITL